MDMTHDETTQTGTTLTTFDPSAPPSLAVALSRAEIDQQITTARALPRSIEKAVKGILTLATLDRESAMECVYALPRGGKPIKGPSIRLAEIIASQWGNCRVGARVVHVDRIEKYIEAEGVFHDLESNTATTSRVRRRISDRQGRLLTDDMIIVTGNAAASIAKRNAVLGAVPKAVWRKAYSKVEGVIAGDVQTLSARRDEAVRAFAHFGVKPDQVYAAIGVNGLGDITIEHIIVLAGMLSALQNNEETVETMFFTAKGDKMPSANPFTVPADPLPAPFLERFTEALALATTAEEMSDVISIYDAELMDQNDATKETARITLNAKAREIQAAVEAGRQVA